MGPFYVYFLYNLDEDVLLYVGRSLNAVVRWQHFMVREDVPAVLGRIDRYDDLDQACAAELDAIETLHPLFNIRRQSSKGNTGMHHQLSEETKAKMRKPKSAQHRANIAAGRKALPPETKKRCADASHRVRRNNKKR